MALVNYCIKGKENRLKLYETVGRPIFYIYSNFSTGTDGTWMGKEDLRMTTDDELKFTAQKIAESYNEYKEFSHLQTELIVKHREVTDGVFETEFSNGEKVVTDYNLGEVEIV